MNVVVAIGVVGGGPHLTVPHVIGQSQLSNIILEGSFVQPFGGGLQVGKKHTGGQSVVVVVTSGATVSSAGSNDVVVPATVIGPTVVALVVQTSVPQLNGQPQ